jgi:hypothetical protein
MTIQDDPNRPRPPYTEPVVNRDPVDAPRTFMNGWGLPLAVAAVVVGGGLLFMSSNSDRTTTASNKTPMTQTNPSGPLPITPVPTPPAKIQ